MDINNKKYADIIVNFSLCVKEKDLVLIKTENEIPQPLVKELFKEILKKNAHPVLINEPSELKEIFFKTGNENQLKYISDIALAEYKNADKIIFISSPKNLNFLNNTDKEKISTRTKATGILTEELMKRTSEGKLSWIKINYPTHSLAQAGRMSLEEYTKLLNSSCFLDEKDPIAALENMKNNQQKIIDILNKASKIRIKGEKTDITFNIKERVWQNCYGKSNFPDGEICTTPVENSANGKIFFDYPSYFRGQLAQGIYLEFKRGKVTKAKAQMGEEFLNEIIKIDEGASRIGELAFGLNEKITAASGSILFDEKIGGSMHIALGLGGLNNSSIHWDIVKNLKNQSEIFLDNKLVYKNGLFLI